MFKLRTAVQAKDELIDQFATRRQKFGSMRAFEDLDKELRSAISQNCLSKRLRRYALLQTDLT